MASEEAKRTLLILLKNRGKTYGTSISRAMREAGYSEKTAKNPRNLTTSKAWNDLLDTYLPDEELVLAHAGLVEATKLDHMVFPTGMADEDIKTLLNSVGCKPRKIQRGDTATHVWFWAPDNKARKDGVELAYKLKGRLKDTVKLEDPDGLFASGNQTLTIEVVDGVKDHTEPEATDSV